MTKPDPGSATACGGRKAEGKRGLSPIYLDDDEPWRLSTVLPHPRRQRIAFGWYGGEYNHLDWLLPLLPESHHYCETFTGSATILLNRAPSSIETYNDVDGEVVNFFRVLRDQGAGIERAIYCAPPTCTIRAGTAAPMVSRCSGRNTLPSRLTCTAARGRPRFPDIAMV